jgi:solute carrier family 25 citrate transporter 1
MLQKSTQHNESSSTFGTGKQLFAGGIAGSVETVITMPFEVTKTWQQLHQRTSLSVFSSMCSIVQTNQIRGLYYGMPAMLIQTSLKVAIRFCAFEQYKVWLLQWIPDLSGKHAKARNFWAGFFAGATEAIVWVTPCERLKILRQSQLGLLHERHTTWHSSLRMVLRAEGIRGLFQGLYPTVLRNSTTMGLRFLMYDWVMIQLLHACSVRQSWHPIASGFLVGTLGTIINNPLDVVKSVIQAQEKTIVISPTFIMQSTNMIQCSRQLFNAAGPSVFFCGMGARIWKVSIGQAVIFFTYEHVITFLDISCNNRMQ